ncbi:MAG: hypothetical protein K6C30_04805 [Bacteroidaceae bacterium]|nr:hypothetical protein [Bacteroidaceae bacterium]
MKRIISILLVLVVLSTPSYAQRRRGADIKSPVAVLKQVREAMVAYDFEHAAELLSTEIARQNKLRRPTADVDSLETLLDEAQRIATKLHATERIIVIDSLVCPKKDMLKAIHLTRESGRLDTYASTYHTHDTLGAMLYENELANKRYLAMATNNGAPLRLAVTDKIGERWSKPTYLNGLDEEVCSQNYPFLLSDGVTLYYASDGAESIGGYDIFVTRADGEDGSFLVPENVGFPFNSPDNDYLLAIDELAQLGWLVTDRRQPEDSVCIYTFIPNATREVYGDDTTEEQLRAMARLTSIRDTWGYAEDTTVLEEARQRLADRRAGKPFGHFQQPDFTFVIDDHRTYLQLSDFQSPRAREMMQNYLQLHKDVETDGVMLQRLRDNYATAQPNQRRQLAETIRRLENSYYPNLQRLQNLAKEIRNAEISKSK